MLIELNLSWHCITVAVLILYLKVRHLGVIIDKGLKGDLYNNTMTMSVWVL